jgi:hypothetical protein
MQLLNFTISRFIAMPMITRSRCFAAMLTVFIAGLVPCRAAALSTASAATPGPGPRLTILGSTGGYTFVDVDGPNAGTSLATGTNLNGLSNKGVAVGFDIDNNGGFHNFFGNVFGTITLLNINGNTAVMAFGINRAGDVVGTDGNGNAFFMQNDKVHTFIPGGGSAATAFGINDNGNIVGQYTLGGQMPGFFLDSHEGNGFVRINAPSGPDIVNAQGVSAKGEIVGFYVGSDGQDHGFIANISQAKHSQLTGTAIADPTIPAVAGTPGATFVFSQILGINSNGIAVGYYGDSTTSQHGFLYNVKTGQYTFMDDPAEAFNNGVEVTQITGINDSGEITGFYSDANGVFHGFFAWPNGLTCPESTASEAQ